MGGGQQSSPASRETLGNTMRHFHSTRVTVEKTFPDAFVELFLQIKEDKVDVKRHFTGSFSILGPFLYNFNDLGEATL